MTGRAPHALVEVPGRREQLVKLPVPGHRHLGPLAGVDDESQVFFYIIAGERFPLKIPDLPGLRRELSGESRRWRKGAGRTRTRAAIAQE